MSWLRPLSIIQEEQTMIRNVRSRPDRPPPTDKEHFLVIGCARKSSHPGAAAMPVVLQNLVLTINAHNNFLNQPAQHHDPVRQRPGGAGTHMQRRMSVGVDR